MYAPERVHLAAKFVWPLLFAGQAGAGGSGSWLPRLPDPEPLPASWAQRVNVALWVLATRVVSELVNSLSSCEGKDSERGFAQVNKRWAGDARRHP